MTEHQTEQPLAALTAERGSSHSTASGSLMTTASTRYLRFDVASAGRRYGLATPMG
jgi:hypothetical protein